MKTQDKIALTLNIASIQYVFNADDFITGDRCVPFPKEVYGTQDRSFMQTKAYRQKQSKQMKEVWANNYSRKEQHKHHIQTATRKPVVIDNVRYDSLTLAAQAYSISVEGIRKRIKSGKCNGHYV